MARKRVKLTTEQAVEMGVNPFVDSEFVIEISKRVNKDSFKLDTDSQLIPSEYNQETTRATRIYSSPEMRKSVALLSASASVLLLWLIFEAEPSQDFVIVNRVRYLQEHKHKTDTPLRKGLYDLIRYQFILPTKFINAYWINPRFLFCGSRMMKYKTHLRVKKQTQPAK